MKKFYSLALLSIMYTFANAQNIWVQKANFGGNSRSGSTGFSIGNKGYIGLGWDGSSFKNDIWEYDPGTNSWTQKANFSGTARQAVASFVIGTKGYIGGGIGSAYYNDFWEFDPINNIWTLKGNLPGTQRYAAAGMSIGSKGYLGLGGVTSSGPFYNDFYEYDPLLNTWTAKANFPGAARSGATGFVVGSKGYIGLGSTATINAYYNDMYEYDPSNNSWTTKANLPAPGRTVYATFAIGNSGYIGCGTNYATSANYNDFWEFNPSSNSWTQRANFGGTPRTSCGFSIGNYGFMGTGKGGTYNNDFWEYMPIGANITATFSSLNNTCFGGNSGSASVSPSGGTPPYTFLWSPSGGTNDTASGLSAGTYTCLITDSLGNTLQQTIIITQPSAISSTISSTATGCTSNSGTASVVASGGTGTLTYSWSPYGGTGSSATGLGIGTYSCTITDANGCMQTDITTITLAPSPIATVNSLSNVLCNGGNTGTATVNVSGGTPGYSYSWSPIGGNTSTGTGFSIGTYTCTITDAAGCTTTQSVNITEPAPLSTSISSDTATCGNANGSASVNVSGGTGTYSYLWNNSQTTSTINNLSGGNYSVSITDANGCTINASTIVIAVSAQVVSTQSTVNLFCYGGTNGTASVNVSGGFPPFVYSWAPMGGNSAVATNLVAGTYTVTVIGSDGCIQTQLITLTQPSAIQISSSAVPENCITNNGSAAVSVNGGTPGYTYLWSNNSTNDTISNLSSGTYSITVIDANGCTSSANVFVPLINSANANAGSSVTITLGQSTVLNGNSGVTYNWSPSSSLNCSNCQNPTATPTITTTYTLIVTDTNGCQGIDSVTVVVDIPCGEVFVPNAFSPNGDNENDVFFVRGICIVEMEFKVYNRWGENVFTSLDKNLGWDGTFNGTACEAAVFTYFLHAQLADGSVITKQGNISLVK